MVREIRGELVAKPDWHFAIVQAQFNSLITDRLAAAAVDALLRHGVQEHNILKVSVPGSFEIPTVAAQMAKSDKYAAIINLGCVIRGQTTHYDHVAGQVAQGVAAVGRETGVPTIFGIITADTVEQAMDRSGLKMGNAGWTAACAAIEMAGVMDQLKKTK